jgi:hypothetical protein
LSKTLNVAAGSSAPLIAIASPLAAVGVPESVTVIVTPVNVPDAIPCHSSRDEEPAAGLYAFLAVVSNVIPVAEILETVIVIGFSLTTTRIESGLELLERLVIWNVLPLLQDPVCSEAPFASIVGTLPIPIV